MPYPPLIWRPTHRILVITGHYGSGKTNVAVNLAMLLRREGTPVTLIDFDTVNPYFRAADNRATLALAGVRAIIPDYANTNLDMPTVPPDVYSVFDNDDGIAIFDVGGDDDGATALGMFSGLIEKAGYDMLYVVSKYRPLTMDPENCAALMSDIEAASRLRCTHIVNNSNIGEATDGHSLTDSTDWLTEVMRRTGLGCAFSATLERDDIDYGSIGDVLVMKNETVRPWDAAEDKPR